MTNSCNKEKKFHGYLDMRQKGMWRNTTALFSLFKPADLELYRSLLRPPLEMPETPAVAIFMFDYHDVKPTGAVPYLEYAYCLRCKYLGKEGWHILTMPVNRFVPLIGIFLGFPKYIASEMMMSPTDINDGWSVLVKHEDQLKMSLEFTPGLTRKLDTFEKNAIHGSAFDLDEPLYGFIPPNTGLFFNRVMVEDVVESKWERKKLGMAKARIGSSEPFSGLIAPDAEGVCALMRYHGGCILVDRTLGFYWNSKNARSENT
ncbi:hypothetical protein HDN1F_36660 [gamma proteobacterium HdN1]|nr:hypothetical protein HDN1F_36660 [gamma proteobacterium HdN1]